MANSSNPNRSSTGITMTDDKIDDNKLNDDKLNEEAQTADSNEVLKDTEAQVPENVDPQVETEAPEDAAQVEEVQPAPTASETVVSTSVPTAVSATTNSGPQESRADVSPVTGETITYKTWYRLKPSILGYSLYDGSIELASTEEQPASTTDVAPYLPKNSEYAAYFRDGTWDVGLNFDSFTFEQLQARLTKNINRMIDQKQSGITILSEADKSTWSIQVAAANEFKDSGTVNSVLQTIADAQGIEPVDVAHQILSRNDEYQVATLAVIGAGRKLSDLVNSFTCKEELINGLTQELFDLLFLS